MPSAVASPCCQRSVRNSLVPSRSQACDAPRHGGTTFLPSGIGCAAVLLGPRLCSASAGTSFRRKRRKFLPSSERRIEILLPKLRQSALIHPQYDGTCPTCSAWRYDSLRGPPMRMPQWRHRLLGKRPGHRSPQKSPSMPVGKARKKKKHTGTRDGPGSYATASSQTPRAADSTTDHGKLRLIHRGNAASLRIWTATVWDCPSVQIGPFATECLPLYR
ncbi:hypothetical protein TcG_12788 [Trypanosoma cruzi]|nr:hypothetical protein TcG_12788 [Trypanosoma cruzi]